MYVTNDKEIRVFGIMRSGNHAIIRWIFSQIPGKVFFLNNCYPEGESLKIYGAKGRFDCKGIKYWDFKKKPFIFLLKLFKNKEKELVSYVGDDKSLDLHGLRDSKKEAIIVSFENKDIEDINERFNRDHDALVGRSKVIFSVIILRDPFNHFASIYKRNGLSRLRKLAPLWKKYAENFIAWQNQENNHFTAINYNYWVQDAAYRQSIARQLKIPFTDRGKNVISSFGGGSSFRDLSANELGNNSVFNRWHIFSNDKQFLSIFSDQEIIDLSDRIFGKIEGTEIFRA